MELEAKWDIPTTVTVANVEQCDWSPFQLGDRVLLRQINQYFDTPDQRLRSAHWGLRLRNENDDLILTLKGQSAVEAGISERPEYEAHVTGADPSTWPQEIMEHVQPLIGDQPLVQFLQIVNGRQAWQVLREGRTVGELALDTGTIYAGERRESIHELEWELKGGSRADFDQFAARVGELLPVVPLDTSKLARGVALLETTDSPGGG